MEWLGTKQIQIDPPKKPKKLTGTRFATVLGLNKWSTPFEIWCAITKTYEEPFSDTIYTLAGKAIEPIQIEYMRNRYYLDLITPTDKYGENYFRKTYGNFFDHPILGGMWDALQYEDGELRSVLEFKTTKRAEDWKNDIPEYYALQAALYAYLLGVDEVIMVASFLEESDYDHPEQFVPTFSNTITRPFLISERYPDFETDYINPALAWWQEYVVTGLSPVYDEQKDADILKTLRTNNIAPTADIQELISEAESITTELEQNREKEKRLKELKAQIKAHLLTQFNDDNNTVIVPGGKWEWAVVKSNCTQINKELLEQDGLLGKYTVEAEKYTLSAKLKEDK